MLTMVRRFLLIVALSLSFGGSIFYAAVVVPIGSQMLDSTSQGFVTQKVTHGMNAATAATIAILIWEAVAIAPRLTAISRWLLLAIIVMLVLSNVALIGLHFQLDDLLMPESFSVIQPARFYRLHQFYLWISIAQWLVMLVVIGWLVRAWRTD